MFLPPIVIRHVPFQCLRSNSRRLGLGHYLLLDCLDWANRKQGTTSAAIELMMSGNGNAQLKVDISIALGPLGRSFDVGATPEDSRSNSYSPSSEWSALPWDRWADPLMSVDPKILISLPVIKSMNPCRARHYRWEYSTTSRASLV